MLEEDSILLIIFNDINEDLLGNSDSYFFYPADQDEEEIPDEEELSEDEEESSTDRFENESASEYRERQTRALIEQISEFIPLKDKCLTKVRLYEIHRAIIHDEYTNVNCSFFDILECLCFHYIVNKVNKNNETYEYLKNNKLGDIFKRFRYDLDFASELLYNYYNLKIYNNKIEEVTSNDIKSVDRFVYSIKTKVITDQIRGAIYNVMETLLDESDPESVITFMVGVFANKPLENIPEDVFDDIKFIRSNIQIVIRVLYGDLYEYICSFGNVTKKELTYCDNFLLHCIKNGIYEFPNEHDLGAEIVGEYFGILSDYVRMVDDRNMLDEEHLKVLSRVNPFYVAERSMLGYENK